MNEYRQPSSHARAEEPRSGTAPATGRACRMRVVRWGITRARGRIALCMFALLSCTTDGNPDPAPGVDTTQTPASTVGAPDGSDTSAPGLPPDEVQAEPAGVVGAAWTEGDTRESRTVTGAALLRDMRTARHDGFDRIVLDFGADDVPSYGISYIDRPVRQCGSGDTVPLAGDAWLAVVVEPANAHTEEGAPTVRERERAPGLPAVLELKMICDFEAMVEVVAGVRAPGAYRAFVLREPNRLVVDIRHGARE